MAPLKNDVVSVPEAAVLLLITTVTVRNLIADGTLDGVKRGRDWWVTRASVDAEFARRYPGLQRVGE